jgi:DNA-binding transcriptional LysR family regulator
LFFNWLLSIIKSLKRFNSEIEINSNEAIIEAVQAGLGIGFVSKHTVKLELENSIIKQLNNF